jgi:hypothetical protein
MQILSTIRHRIWWALAILTGSAAFGLIPGTVADAANPEPVTVDMNFLDPVTIMEVNPLRFGLLDVNMANTETITIAPGGGVSGDTGRIFGGTQGAANLTVTASASQAITILVDNVSTANGYSLGTWMCNYNTGTDTGCDGSGYSETSATSATLLVGVTLTANGTATVGTDNSTFDVTVSYQ